MIAKVQGDLFEVKIQTPNDYYKVKIGYHIYTKLLRDYKSKIRTIKQLYVYI